MLAPVEDAFVMPIPGAAIPCCTPIPPVATPPLLPRPAACLAEVWLRAPRFVCFILAYVQMKPKGSFN